MLAWLERIWCAVSNVAWWIADLLVFLVNGFFSTFGALVAAALSVLPNMPEQPGVIDSDVLQWVNWMFPVGPLVAMVLVYFALYIAVRLIIAAVRMADKLAGLGGGGS